MTPSRFLHTLSVWMRAFRPPAQINLALPMLVGMAHGAACDTGWSDLPWLSAVGVSLLLQAMILFSNEASDAATDDPTTRTMISGGAGVGASGAVSPLALRRAALAAAGLGLVVCFMAGAGPLAGLWLAAAALVWAYDGRWRLSRHPLGSVCQAVGVGVVTPLLGAWLVAPSFWPSGHDVALGLCLGFAGHILTALPDEPADRNVGKMTLVVCLGQRAGLVLLLTGLAIAGILLFGAPQAAVCTADTSISWPYRVGALAGLGLLLGLAWRLRGRSGPGGLTLDVWVSGGIALALWIIWILY